MLTAYRLPHTECRMAVLQVFVLAEVAIGLYISLEDYEKDLFRSW